MLYNFGHAFVHEAEYFLEHIREAALFKLALTLELDGAKEALKQHLWTVTQNNATRVRIARHTVATYPLVKRKLRKAWQLTAIASSVPKVSRIHLAVTLCKFCDFAFVFSRSLSRMLRAMCTDMFSPYINLEGVSVELVY